MKSALHAILINIPLSDFDGVNDPVQADLICPDTLGEALEERVRFYIDNAPDITKDLANAYIEDVNWYDVAIEYLEENSE